MRLDLTPYRRSTIGFDRLFDLLETSARNAQSDNYPPFNLERVADDRYRITLAVAGFTRDEIEITAQQNLLLVAGKKDDKATGPNFLHVGIATRSFERRFELADFVFVEDARLNDGLLVIDLVREVPEAMKPKKINIGASGSGAGTTPCACGRCPRCTVISRRCPPRTIARVTSDSAPRVATTVRSCELDVSRSPPIVSMRSPGRRPALAAGLSGSTLFTSTPR